MSRPPITPWSVPGLSDCSIVKLSGHTISEESKVGTSNDRNSDVELGARKAVELLAHDDIDARVSASQRTKTKSMGQSTPSQAWKAE